MLPQAERLKRAGLFQRVYTARKTVSTELVSLYVLAKQPRPSARPPLVGFVAGKKTLSNAVDRNRAKRRLREAYRLLRRRFPSDGDQASPPESALKLEQWYALVWVIQGKLLEADFSEIEEAVRYCLQKADQKFGSKRASK